MFLNYLYLGSSLALLVAIAGLIQSRIPFFNRLAQEAPVHSYPNLDGLRGLLALSVIFSHTFCNRGLMATGNWNAGSLFMWGLGSFPVCIFFMITGMLFWQKAHSETFNTTKFLINRLRRLAPLYYFGAAIVILFSIFWSTGIILDHPYMFTIDLLKTSALGLAGSFPINNDLRITRINGVWWTLAYEWKFYLTVPLLALYIIPHAGRKWLFLSTVLALAILFPAEGVYAFLFEMGAVAQELSKNIVLRSFMSSPIAAAGTLVIAGLFFCPIPCTLWGTAPLFPFFLCIVCGNNFGGILENRFSSFLGTISYSIYLNHMVIVYVIMHAINTFLWQANTLSDEKTWAAGIFASAITLCISTLSYRYIEYPFLGIQQEESLNKKS